MNKAGCAKRKERDKRESEWGKRTLFDVGWPSKEKSKESSPAKQTQIDKKDLDLEKVSPPGCAKLLNAGGSSSVLQIQDQKDNDILFRLKFYFQ